ncbi:MAG TPA: hypothetical protein VJ914_05675 [Pseudonocardiaceae bacterium]|nr:hypothetical protein [Pseudonocardiaceae bacterium]
MSSREFEPVDAAAAGELEDLLGFIRDARGFEFTGYKRSSLARRIRKRLANLSLQRKDVAPVEEIA